jgi:molecular chaperone GrpE
MTDERETQESEGAGDGPPGAAQSDPAAETEESVTGTADPGTGPETAESPDEVATEVDELRDELEALNERHLRLAAEFDNYRKRNERDRSALATRLQANLVSSLLDVLDDLQRVEESGVDEGGESVLEGVRLVEKKFVGVLEGAGLEPVEAESAVFDPELMEALAAVPTDDPEKDHRVADVFQRGYRFRDVLIRPARVRVWQYQEPEDSE